MDYSDIKDDVLNVTYWKKENRFNEDGFFVTKWTHLKRRKITVKELQMFDLEFGIEEFLNDLAKLKVTCEVLKIPEGTPVTEELRIIQQFKEMSNDQ